MEKGTFTDIPSSSLPSIIEKSISARLGLTQDSTSPEQLRRVREEVGPALTALGTSFFSSVETELNRSFIAYANGAWTALDGLISEYRSVYGRAISEMRERDLAEQMRVNDELESIRLDHKLVEGHLKVLRVTLKRLCEV